MDAVTLALLILLLVLVFGGLGWPRPAEGPATLNGVLYLLAVVVVVGVLVRLVGVLA